MKKKKKSVLSVLFGYAGRHKYLSILSWVLSAVSALMALMPFVYVWLILRDVLQGQYAAVAHWGWMAVWWALGSMVVYLAALMCSHIAAFRIAANMRKHLMQHIVTLPVGFVDAFGTGRLRKTVNDASAATETYLAHRLPDAAGSYATPVGLLVLFVWFDWRMGLLCLLTAVVAFAIMFVFMIGPKLKQTMAEYQGALDRMSNEAVEYVRGIPVVKTFGQTVYSFHRFKAAIDDYGHWVISYTRSMRRPMVAYTVVINAAFAVLIGYALFSMHNTQFIMHNSEFLLNLLFYFIISSQLTLMLYRVMMQSEDRMIVEDAIERVERVLNTHPLPLPKRGEYRIPKDNSVELRNVRFGYKTHASTATASTPLALGMGTGVRFYIKSGEHVAFVGPSGGGKTTLASLVARFWDVDEGEVLIGGVNVKDIAKTRLSETVSFVFQDSRLLKTSILENVRLARPSASQEEVLAALHKAQCDDILEKLPQGIDTVIGTHGTYLSGGEQQRIAIARVILQDAPILILDEATAFADPDNEQRVLKAFAEMSQGKTVLMIAHRLSTVTNADRIYVLSDGQIAEQGRHEQLLTQKGLYNKMWNDYNNHETYELKN